MTAAREIVRSLVDARLYILEKEQYMFGTIGDKPKPTGVHKRISDFINHPKTQDAIHSSTQKFMGAVSAHHYHRGLVSAAIVHGLKHAAELDTSPDDLEHMVHHHIEHLSTSLSISKTMAHGVLSHAVGKLKELRGIKEGKDDELDMALSKLHSVLRKIAPHYKPDSAEKPPSEPKPEPKEK